MSTRKTEKQTRTARASRKAGPRKVAAADKPSRIGNRREKAMAELQDLYGGLDVPDFKDRESREVVGLRKQVLHQRKIRWPAVEQEWQSAYRGAIGQELTKDKYAANLKRFLKKQFLPPAGEGLNWFGQGLDPRRMDPSEYLKNPKIVPELLAAVRKSNQGFVIWEGLYNQVKALQNTRDWPALPRFDWREQGLDVGAVLNQGKCNSCWAFVAISVYQSTWFLEQMRSGEFFLESRDPEAPSSQNRVASVQQLLNCIGKKKGTCGGGWHGSAFAYMVESHVPHIPDKVVERLLTQRLESGIKRLEGPGPYRFGGAFHKIEVEGYTGKVSPCRDVFRHTKVKRGGGELELDNPGSAAGKLPKNSDRIQTAFDRALAWGYVDEQKPDRVPSVKQLKRALVEHGPVAMPLHGDHSFTAYRGGVFKGDSTSQVNHMVVLIGWDDKRQAWLIKNQYGESWGEKGYAWVAYGSNNIGKFAAWIQPSPNTDTPWFVKDR